MKHYLAQKIDQDPDNAESIVTDYMYSKITHLMTKGYSSPEDLYDIFDMNGVSLEVKIKRLLDEADKFIPNDIIARQIVDIFINHTEQAITDRGYNASR